VKKQRTQPIRTVQVNGAHIKIMNVLNQALQENVVIVNQGTLPQPLSGWALASLRGDSLFFFPDDLILGPDKSLYVHSGQSASEMTNSLNVNLALDFHIFWTDEQVWNNHSDVAVLFDAHGEEVDRYAYPHTLARRSAFRYRKRLVHNGGQWHIEDKPKPEVQTVRPKEKRAPRRRRNHGGL